jgi:hypothetical protein
LDKVVVSSSTTQKNNNKKKNQKQKNTTNTTFSLLLSGLDIVDGTPILDIKPYVPHYDCVGYTDDGNIDAAKKSAGTVGKQFHDDDHNNNNQIVRVPHWVDSGLRKRRSIVFLHAAEQFLTNLATPSSSSSSSLPSLLSQLRFYGPNSPWNDASSTIAVQHIRNVIIEVLTADVRSVWQTAKARRGEFHAERSQRLSVLKSSSPTTIPNDMKEEVGAGGTRLMVEGNDGGMIECCTQQIDNLLVHYTIAGPTTSTSTSTSAAAAAAGTDTNGSDTMISATDERSLGSGAEDSVVVVSISLI